LSVEFHTESWRIELVGEGFDIAIRASDVLDDSGSVARKLMTMQQFVYALYPSRRHVPAKVRAFLDFLVEELSS
jgi:DNA-binding transcriptional LysR family regulator